MNPSTRRLLVVLAPLATFALVVAVVLATRGGQTTREPQGAPRALAAANSGATLRVFKRPQKPNDALPRLVAHQISVAAGRHEIKLQRSRRAFTTGLGTRVFAVPGRGAVCVASAQRSGQASVGCGPPAAIRQGYVFDVGWDPGDVRGGKLRQVRIEGLLPDGVRKVRFPLSRGGTESTAVRGNAYYAVLSAWPARIIFTAPAGKQLARIPELPKNLRQIAP